MLLYKYYRLHERFPQAAAYMYQLAQQEGDLNISGSQSRIEYLNLAVNAATTACSYVSGTINTHSHDIFHTNDTSFQYLQHTPRILIMHPSSLSIFLFLFNQEDHQGWGEGWNLNYWWKSKANIKLLICNTKPSFAYNESIRWVKL